VALAGRRAPRRRAALASFPGPFLYYPSRRQMPSALRAFIDFVKVWKAAPT